ncbi:MAG TPA: SLC13 family permease [Pseudomonadales bacterium]
MAEYVYLAVVLAVALYLFWTQRVRTDVTAVLVMLSLALPWPRADGRFEPILTYTEAYSGFGSSAVIMIASMFVIGAAIVQTGVAETLGLNLLRRVAKNEWQLQFAVLAVSTFVSMFINDTTVVLILLPLVLGICREHGLSPSRYLMFVAYGSLLGGQWTLIGTRSNIIVSDFLEVRTGEGIGFFDFTPVAAVVFVVAAVYLMTVGRRLLPNRPPVFSRMTTREFLTEVMVPEGSSAIGQRLFSLEPFRRQGLTAVALLRGGRRVSRFVELEAGDVIIVRGTVDTIGALIKSPDFKVREEVDLDESILESAELVTVEAVVPAHSDYRGHRVNEAAFNRDYGVTVVGMARHGRPIGQRLMRTRLEFGDSLLFLGTREEVDRLRQNTDLILLDEQTFPAIGRKRAWVMLVLLGLIIGGSASGLVSAAYVIPVAALAAILFGCIGLRSAYAAIDWPTIVTLGGIIPFSLALEKTGAAAALAELVVSNFEVWGAVAVLASLLLVAAVLTQLIENAAVAIIVAPIAYQVAENTGLDGKSMLVALAIVVSSGFSTPVAHESTILVMGPGRYEFRHYLALGSGLALLTWLVTTLVTPLVFDF